MLEAPTDVTDAEVLALVREHWSAPVDRVAHLPIGFGAHHWHATVGDLPAYFVTFDRFGDRHTAASLEAAYAGVSALSFALDFAVAPLPSGSGRCTVPLADGALSVTLWVAGERAGDGPLATRADAEESARQLARLHAQPAAATFPRWAPLVRRDLAETLATRLETVWDSGPYGERARTVLLAHLDDVARWTAAYHRRAEEAAARSWVPTHGEPHTRNLVRTLAGPLRLVDWESLKVAPRERDLRTLVDSGHADLADPYWPMIELFDLEWRLDEVTQYAVWFAAPHTGTASDRVAFDGLVVELERPGWACPT